MLGPLLTFSVTVSTMQHLNIDVPSDPGVYVLVIEVSQNLHIRVKSGKVFSLESGIYIYVGSALKGLRSRLRRYIEKKFYRKHWHIDYLLDCEGVNIRKIIFSIVLHWEGERPEVVLSRSISQLDVVPVRGFGCTDLGRKVVANLYRSNMGIDIVNHVVKLMKTLFGNVYEISIG